MDTPSKIFFQEEQQFTQRWIWALLILFTVPLSVFMLYVMYRQLVLGEPVGNNPMPNSELIWFGPLIIVIMIGMLVLFKATKLSVQIDSRFLHIRFFPFFKRNIPVDQIVKWEARQYKPILEYGGWGIRFWFGGKAYNVSGNHGVQLELAGNKKLLIGSQHSKEFAAAIETAKSFNRKS